MMCETPDFGSVELDLNNFVGVGQPTCRWNRIAWNVVFNEDPSAVIRRGYVNAHAPVGRPKTCLSGIGETDFNDSSLTIRERLRISACHPQQNFVAIEIVGDIHVAAGVGKLPLEIHIP